MISSDLIRKKFLDFFKKKGHVVVPSSSLVPDDPSVLLTTAGMQQFKKYYTGEQDPQKDFGSLSVASCQKSFRTSDIDEVGDESHLTFFEMLGNFSFGGYFKKEAISYAHEFITQELNLPISYVTVFEGKDSIGVPKDEESKKIWESLGIPSERIKEQGMDDVFWGPTGSSGPCGPTTEIYCKNALGQDVEVWNIVFNEFFCDGSREDLLSGKAKLSPLKQKGIDTGMGLERLAMCAQKTSTVFETDVFAPLMDVLPSEMEQQTKRVLADHARGIVFLAADGVEPSNKGAGYVLRRLLRRAMAVGKGGEAKLYAEVVSRYADAYPQLFTDRDRILSLIEEEEGRFNKTLQSGFRELSRVEGQIDAKMAFMLYESFGIPFEVIKDYGGGSKAKNLTREDFEREFEHHQEISRAGSEKKFGGHGLILDTGELKAGSEEDLKKVVRMHTATHLLQWALRNRISPDIRQMGSDITPERLRFDFNLDRKLEDEEIKKVEEAVNEQVRKDLPVSYKEMGKEEAEASGALSFFKEKYPDRVKVYFIGGPEAERVISAEFCGGPHVSSTGEIGVFRILKQESVGKGMRRIRATVE
jgi:alanyl-tRNA synthetase